MVGKEGRRLLQQQSRKEKRGILLQGHCCEDRIILREHESQ